MTINNINNIFKGNPKYLRLQKPLQAANVCDTARTLTHYRFDVISFKDGLLTLGVNSSAQAANLQMQSTQIIKEVNQKLGQILVEKIRTKIQ